MRVWGSIADLNNEQNNKQKQQIDRLSSPVAFEAKHRSDTPHFAVGHGPDSHGEVLIPGQVRSPNDVATFEQILATRCELDDRAGRDSFAALARVGTGSQ